MSRISWGRLAAMGFTTLAGLGALAILSTADGGGDVVPAATNEPAMALSATTSSPPSSTVFEPTTASPPISTVAPASTTLPQPPLTNHDTKFHPVDIEVLPGRYIAFGRDGILSLVDTATGEPTELYRIPEPVGDDWRRASMSVDPVGEYVYVGSDTSQDCKGTITRVAIDGSEAVDIAEGWGPLVSPDGLWLVYTIDGATNRGEVPPVSNDPMLPCRGRHDSYAWFDLSTGTETRWIAPPLEQFRDPVDRSATTFEPDSHRLYLATWSIYTAFSVVTPDLPDPGTPPEAFSQAGENFDSLLISSLQFLPDGSVLVAGSLPDIGFPPGYRLFQSPDGYDAGPADVSQPWWLISGYQRSDPGDWTGIHRTWVWNQIDDPVLIAENVHVQWMP